MSHIHVIGAGVSGLAAAIALGDSGHTIHLYEVSSQAGGRCRSYFDKQLGCAIDNGNHLLIKANKHARALLKQIGAAHKWQASSYDIKDAQTGKALGLWQARELVMRSALNTEPKESAKDIQLMVLAKALMGGAAPLLPHGLLSETLIDPALAYLAERGIEPKYNKRLEWLSPSGDILQKLFFYDEEVMLEEGDQVILALPSNIAEKCLPESRLPNEFESIINGHFLCDLPDLHHHFYGISGGFAEWIFVKDGVVSTTISAANRYAELSQEEIAQRLWRDVCWRLKLDKPMPEHRIITEKRATLKTVPKQLAKRPFAKTAFKNLFLAGDYIQTGLPPTIESSVISGKKAAALAISNARITS